MTFDTLENFLEGIERRAYRMALIATSSREDALDLVQDAMLILVEKYANRDAEEWPPLFYRVLQSRIRDWYRRNKVRNKWRAWFGHNDSGEADSAESHIDPASMDGLQQTQLDKATDKLDRALQALPLRQQQVFLLRVWEGMSVAETARIMKCSQGSVKSHCSRAVHTLREQLKEDWP